MWSYIPHRFFVCLTGILLIPPISRGGELEGVLSSFQKEFHFPALGAAVIHADGTIDVAVVGVRKMGSDVAANAGDQFHLGSCTKGMTATLLALLVEQGKLSWDTTVAEGLPDLAKEMRPEYREVTLRQLLSHWAGLPASDRSMPEGMSGFEVWKLSADPRKQRHEYLKRMLTQPPVSKPGTKWEYSNVGYTVAAAMAEQVLDEPWEVSMQTRIFTPLGMKSAGFGPMGVGGNKAGRIDQPWQHVWDGKKHTPIEPLETADNPPAIWPGGGVHCSMEDWAKFVRLHLQNQPPTTRGRAKIAITSGTLQQLHTPVNDGNYALGWGVEKGNEANDLRLTHAGSNTMNYCLASLRPHSKTAILVATNQAGDDTEQHVLEIARKLAEQFLPKS